MLTMRSSVMLLLVDLKKGYTAMKVAKRMNYIFKDRKFTPYLICISEHQMEELELLKLLMPSYNLERFFFL